MKNFTIILFLIFSLSVLSQEQITITQSNDTNEILASGLACIVTQELEDEDEGLFFGMYFDNYFARSFDLQNDHNINGDFVISNIGIAQRFGKNTNVDINLYSSNTEDLSDPNLEMTLVGTQTFPVFDINNNSFLFINVEATIPAGEILVVEIFVPNSGASTNENFYLGINNAGHTKPTYIKAPNCDVEEYMNTVLLGEGDQAYIMTVTGQETLSVNQNEINKIEVFPNPVDNQLNINLPANLVLNEALLIDMNAKVQNVSLEGGVMDVSNIASGQYMLRLDTNSGIFIHKVIKK